MNDNIVQFRKPKKPDPKPPVRREPPPWVWFGALVALAVAIYLLRQAGLFGA